MVNEYAFLANADWTNVLNVSKVVDADWTNVFNVLKEADADWTNVCSIDFKQRLNIHVYWLNDEAFVLIDW